MEVITTLTLEDIHKILLSEMRHWRMQFKVTLTQWLAMVATRNIENETGEGTFSKTDCDNEETKFDYCGIGNFISSAIKNGINEKVLFYWDYDTDTKEYTLTNIDAPESMSWAAKWFLHECHEDKDTDECPHKKTNLPPNENGKVFIKSDRKLYIDFKTCARYMAFVPDITGDDHARLEDWIIYACLPLIKSDCKNADIRDVEWQSVTDLAKDMDKFICKAEAMGILLDARRFPQGSLITLRYLYDPNGLLIDAPKLLTEDGKELPDLDLYSEPIMWLPKDKWKYITTRDRVIPSVEMLENFWALKDRGIKEVTYSQWLMIAAGATIQTELGGADLMTNWNEDEAEALEKLMNDCEYSDEFKVTYSLEDELEDKCAYTCNQLNIYSCELKKD